MNATVEERSERRATRRNSQERSKLLVVILAVVVIAFLAWFFFFRSSGGDKGGALVLQGGADVPAAAAKVGAPVSYGFDLRNRGGGRLVVDRVSLVSPTTGLRLVGMYTATQGSAPGLSAGFTWPRGASEVEGMIMEPGDQPHPVVIGVQVDAQGVFRSPGLRIDYHVGDTEHSQVFPLAMQLCAPARIYRARCTG